MRFDLKRIICENASEEQHKVDGKF